jgi:hypothetical protein
MFSFYADESGNPDIHDPREWYVLLAIGLDDSNWKDIDDQVLALKKRFFSGWQPHAVEIHSNTIRRARLEAYPPNPFSLLSEAQLKEFTDILYEIIMFAPFEWCAAAVNKPGVVRKHGFTKAAEVFKMAYMLLVERLHGWCQQKKTQGRLFVDQQESNLIGAVHDLIEKDHFSFQDFGTGFLKCSNIIERPYFIDSCRSNHMQLADILAYNVYRRFDANEPGYSYFRKTMAKVRGNQNPVTGAYYGLKIYP